VSEPPLEGEEKSVARSLSIVPRPADRVLAYQLGATVTPCSEGDSWNLDARSSQPNRFYHDAPEGCLVEVV
jgi:hypothetical protein